MYRKAERDVLLLLQSAIHASTDRQWRQIHLLGKEDQHRKNRHENCTAVLRNAIVAIFLGNRNAAQLPPLDLGTNADATSTIRR